MSSSAERPGQRPMMSAAISVLMLASCSVPSTSLDEDAEFTDRGSRSEDSAAPTRPADALHVPPELDGGTPDGLLPDAAVDAQLDICNVDRGVIAMTDLEFGVPVWNGDFVRVGGVYALNDTWPAEHPNWLHEPCFNNWMWTVRRQDEQVNEAIGEYVDQADGTFGPEDWETPNAVIVFFQAGHAEIVLLRRDGREVVPPQTRTFSVVIE